MTSTISRTTFTFEVLHRTDEPFSDDYQGLEPAMQGTLGDALARSWDGHAVGWVTTEVTTEVPDQDVPEVLVTLGNDGEFFDDDLGVGTEHTWVTIPADNEAQIARLTEILDAEGEEVRARALADGDLYAEYGLEPRVIRMRGDHGDAVLLTHDDGSETTIDGDEVVQRVPAGEF